MSENKFCTACGEPLGEGAVFCAECGAKVVNNTVNQTDGIGQGTQTNSQQNFNQDINTQTTQQYGQPVINQQQVNQQPVYQQQPMNQQAMNPNMAQQPYNGQQFSPLPTPEQQQKNNKSGKLIARIIGIVAIVAAVFLVYKMFLSYPSKPEDVAVNFVEALMVDMSASETSKYVIEEHNNMSDIREVISDFKEEKIKVSNVHSTNVDIDGDTAEVTVSVKLSLGEESITQEVNIELTQESGKWKVSDFN